MIQNFISCTFLFHLFIVILLAYMCSKSLDTWSFDGLLESCFQYYCLLCKSHAWVIYLFCVGSWVIYLFCVGSSHFIGAIKCRIIFSLLFKGFLTAKGGSGWGGGWGQWPNGWKMVENLIWTVVIYNVIILLSSWVKTRGYGSEISICLNIRCKNWMFFLCWNPYIYTTCPLVTLYILLSLHALFSSFDPRKIPKQF